MVAFDALSAGCVMGQSNQKNMQVGLMKLAAGVAAAALLAGCSSDVSRLAEGPFGVDRMSTASIPSRNTLTPPETVGAAGAGSQQMAGLGPTSSISSVPLAPIGGVQSAPLSPPPAAAPMAAAPLPAAPAAPALARPAAAGPWTAAGGTTVTVGANDTAAALAGRYGVPQDALLRVNGLTSAAQVRPGAWLVIPVYNAAGGSPAAAAAAPVAARAATQAQAAGQQTLARAGQTASLQQQAALAPQAQAAQAAQKAAEDKAAQAKRAEEAAKAKAAAAAVAAQKTAAAPVAAAPAKVAKVEEPAKAAPEAEASAAAADKPEFRWPARGRIIQGFKPGASEGIKIAVPEGTAVKAAEAGVVAYAGSELKGYGNLVLIRHPNGFVSAYAHNGEVSVRRGDSVKRGQVIAKSGQSGNVSSPQLHFELRKGSTPVDPTGYLAGL
jgi:murein DD-endopeptidase MepM/ murein hydrolase activator NlpD